MNCKWDCIVITCRTLSSVKSVEKEIELLKKKGRIDKSLCVLTIEDPAKSIGSGAATLNALIIATEYLSAKQNYMVISSNVLLNARILIMHNGRNNLYSCSQKAFIQLCKEFFPQSTTDKFYASGIISNLEDTLQFINELSIESPPGVWICSTDMTILHECQEMSVAWENIKDAVIFCVPSNIEFASGHGVVLIDAEECIANIKYCASIDALKGITDKADNVPVVSGIVFLSMNVAESFLSLQAQTPIDSCTYIGLDSGNTPLQVSLFFDLLIAMSTNMDKTKFISGEYGTTYNLKFGIDKGTSNEISIARSLIWKELSKYRMSANLLTQCKYLYWSNLHCPRYHVENLFKIATVQQIHSICQSNNGISLPLKSIIMNSHIQVKYCTISSNVVILNSSIQAKYLDIKENVFLSGITLQRNESELIMPSNLAVIEILMENTIGENIIVVLGMQENPCAPLNLETDTFCNRPWSKLFSFLQTDEKEIWKLVSNSEEKTLANANLFSSTLCLEDVLYLFCCDNPNSKHESLLRQWKNSKKFSLNEIIDHIDYTKVFTHQRQLYSEVACKIIRKTLCSNEDLYLIPYFYTAVSEGWSLNVMTNLDNILLSNQSSVIKTRTLSNLADLLSIMAGITGGLRSGPGNNKMWEKAFDLLLVGHTVAGIKALMKERSHWMDRADRMMRAARHYERAAQILIQNSVKTVREFISLSSSKLPDFGIVITAECPARIDLQGGWSDTPPICYELGGSVLNVAVLMDGKKPIGASASRIKESIIQMEIEINEMCHEITVTEMKDILNYNQPNVKGALLKAAIICTEIVDRTLETSLSDQLFSKYGGGFKIKSWSILPQGCGMGTSSILAGAIVAVLWSVTGRQYDKSSIIHAVLYVEQLLTTGGGWQDQVSGITGGITRGFSKPNLPLHVEVNKVIVSEEVIKELNERLLLVYTGKVRLAKNLLQNVIRNWYAREESVVKCFQDLLHNASEMKNAVENGNFSQMGMLMEKYWNQKKILAPGCEPTSVRDIMKLLKPLCYGQILVGAGGGGFMCVLTKKRNDIENLKLSLKLHKEYENLSIHRVEIDINGLEIRGK